MKINKWIGAISFCIISLIVTALIYSHTMEVSKGNEMYSLAVELTKGDQVKQILLSIAIYVYGYIVMKALKLEKGEWWDATLAYPVGLLCWCILSSMILILGIPYRFSMMMVVMLLLLAMCFWIIKKKMCQLKATDFLRNLLYVSGIAAIASSGLFWVYMSNDSLYYLVKYGEILAIDGSFTQNVSYWLTWIGVIPATISSLTSFLGLHSIYTIHHMMMIAFVIFFMVTVYEKLIGVFQKKKTVILVAFTTMMLILTPAFFLLGQWVISNTYFMIYMYIFLYIIYEIQEAKMNLNGAYITLSMILIFLTLSRPEAIVTTCFLIICASTLKVEKKDLFKYCLLPSVLAQVAFWIRIYLVQGYLIAGMLSKVSIAVMIIAMVGTGVYLLLLGDWFDKKVKTALPMIMICAIALLNLVLIVLMPKTGVSGINVVLYNIANEYWGFFPWIVAFCYLIFISKSAKINYWDLNWIGFILFNFGLCMGRGSVARYGIGDSLNRIICSIVPVIWFAIIMHVRDLVRERNSDKEVI